MQNDKLHGIHVIKYIVACIISSQDYRTKEPCMRDPVKIMCDHELLGWCDTSIKCVRLMCNNDLSNNNNDIETKSVANSCGITN